MLVLTRRRLESVRLTVQKAEIQGDTLEIEVYFMKYDGSQAQLGFRAPDEVVIDRDEVYRRKLVKNENTQRGYGRATRKPL